MQSSSAITSRRVFGTTGLEVSPLGFGAAPIGFLATKQKRIDQIVAELSASGVNLIDTAAAYEGSEEAIGRALEGRWDDFILVSKCGQSFADLPGSEWSAPLVAATIERSLQRLRTDRIDVVLLHSCGLDVLKQGHAFDALVTARAAGKPRFIGYSGDNETAAAAAAMPRIDVIETSVNLCDQMNSPIPPPFQSDRHVASSRMTFPTPFLAAALLLAVPFLRAEPSFPEPIEVDDERAAVLHQKNPEKFRALPEAGGEIDFAEIDYDLLAAAVFHETNRQRATHDLPALAYQRELREASRIQARGMKHQDGISHEHPKQEKQTVADRLDHVGLRPRFFSENVAMVFGVRYDSGDPFHSRMENGRRIVSDEPGGPPIPPHTYLSFAESLLDSWMNSPGHRRNILAEQPEALGAECHHHRGPDGMDRFFCAQVFFAPLPESAAPAEDSGQVDPGR